MDREQDQQKCMNLEIAMLQAENELSWRGTIKGCKGYIDAGCITTNGQPSCAGYRMACPSYIPYSMINIIRRANKNETEQKRTGQV